MKLNLNILFFFLWIVSHGQSPSRHASPIPGFEIYNLCYGSVTTINNTSAYSDSYTWNIYDTTSLTPILTTTNTSITGGYIFPHKGTFTVELICYNGHTGIFSKEVSVNTITSAKFDYSSCEGKFTNLSTCCSSYYWDFGDGQTSTKHSPVHYYTIPGNYNVKLVVKSGNIKDSITKQVQGISNILSGKFETRIEKDSVFFTAADSTGWLGGTPEFKWIYGDGKSDYLFGFYGLNAKHKYLFKDSTYVTFLLVRNGCFSAYSQKMVVIDGPDIITPGTQIFPNPLLNDVLQITSERKDEITDIKLFNSTGQLLTIKTTKKSQGYDINLNTLPQGTYNLKLYFGDEVISKTIVKP
jgi:PKD repeat protein